MRIGAVKNRHFDKSSAPVMAATIDTGLEFFRQVLALRAYRQEILSADIANASTPGFKAVDLDFAERARTPPPRAAPAPETPANPRRDLACRRRAADRRRAPRARRSAAAEFVKYQAGNEVTLDGNSVDLDHEKVAAAENAVQYEAAATFASQTMRMMMIAITGSGSQQSGGG